MAAPMVGLKAEITLQVDGLTVGPFALPRHPAAEIGRSSGSALRLKPPWAPRRLATLNPSEGGWMLTNGTRTRVRAKSRCLDGCFQANAPVALQQRTCEFDWDLDGECRAEVKIDRHGPPRPLPVALTTKEEAPRIRDRVNALRPARWIRSKSSVSTWSIWLGDRSRRPWSVVVRIDRLDQRSRDGRPCRAKGKGRRVR
jgi:hypothetical protein